MGDLSGKKGLILGVGNQRSIAWAVAEQLHAQGADLGLTYLSDPKGRFEANVRKLGEKVSATFISECDVGDEGSIEQMSGELADQWEGIDFLVHSLAYADQQDLQIPFSQTSRGRICQGTPHQRLFFVASLLGSGSADEEKRRWKHHQHQLHRFRPGRSQLQRDGACQGIARILSPLSSPGTGAG